MNRTDRLLAIVLELQARGKRRAEDLAEAFEVSKRTIYRDIQALCEAGVPVVSEPGTGYSLVDGYFLPPLRFTLEEAILLLLGSDVMRQCFRKQQLIHRAHLPLFLTARATKSACIARLHSKHRSCYNCYQRDRATSKSLGLRPNAAFCWFCRRQSRRQNQQKNNSWGGVASPHPTRGDFDVTLINATNFLTRYQSRGDFTAARLPCLCDWCQAYNNDGVEYLRLAKDTKWSTL